MPTGELILAPTGERIVESRDFYAAFASRIEYRIEHGGQSIGVLPQDSIPAEGEFLLLAGRRWRVNLIDHGSKRVSVVPAKGWKQPRFAGSIGRLDPVVCQRMKRVLSEETSYPFLNLLATQLLAEARQTFMNTGLNTKDTAIGLNGVEWFPWSGSRVLLTLELCAKSDGLKTDRGDLSIRYQKLTATDFSTHRARIAAGAFTAQRLGTLVADLQRDRFDEYVPESLLRRAFVTEAIDVSGAQAVAASRTV